MPKVSAFSLAGWALWFNSNDHQPPHFHAEKGDDWQVRVAFLLNPDAMFEVVYTNRSKRPNKADLKELAELAAKHRAVLLDEWHAKVKVSP